MKVSLHSILQVYTQPAPNKFDPLSINHKQKKKEKRRDHRFIRNRNNFSRFYCMTINFIDTVEL